MKVKEVVDKANVLLEKQQHQQAIDIQKQLVDVQEVNEEQMAEHVPENEEVEQKFPLPHIEETHSSDVPPNRIVKWQYDRENDDDPRIRECDEFWVDEKFVQNKEF